MIQKTQEEIMRDWTADNSAAPLVSICCTAYNHEPFIAVALDGFLMQKTNFSFEVIIHDDCSADGTVKIIKEYQKKYPEIIKPIFQSENQYSKGIRSILATFIYPKCSGTYIAVCEGDDYWIDSCKLQKQVDFLEEHPEYPACFHRAQVLGSEGLSDSVYNHVREVEYDANEILKRWTVPTASFMFRRKFVSEIPSDQDFIYGDIVLFETMARYGNLYCLPEMMSVYRRTDAGIVGGQRKNRNVALYARTDRHYRALRRHFKKISSFLIAWLRIKNVCFFVSFLLRKYVLRSV